MGQILGINAGNAINAYNSNFGNTVGYVATGASVRISLVALLGKEQQMLIVQISLV
jgi:hypothetical protein